MEVVSVSVEGVTLPSLSTVLVVVFSAVVVEPEVDLGKEPAPEVEAFVPADGEDDDEDRELVVVVVVFVIMDESNCRPFLGRMV